MTHAENFKRQLETGNQDVAVKLHADNLAKGSVVEITTTTGVSKAPSAGDEVGLFGVLLEAGDEDDIVACRIRGTAYALTGDTSAVGTFVAPQADYMLNAQTAISLTGEEQSISPKPAFAKLLEAGVDGELKLIQIVSQ